MLIISNSSYSFSHSHHQPNPSPNHSLHHQRHLPPGAHHALPRPDSFRCLPRLRTACDGLAPDFRSRGWSALSVGSSHERQVRFDWGFWQMSVRMPVFQLSYAISIFRFNTQTLLREAGNPAFQRSMLKTPDWCARLFVRGIGRYFQPDTSDQPTSHISAAPGKYFENGRPRERHPTLQMMALSTICLVQEKDLLSKPHWSILGACGILIRGKASSQSTSRFQAYLQRKIPYEIVDIAAYIPPVDTYYILLPPFSLSKSRNFLPPTLPKSCAPFSHFFTGHERKRSSEQEDFFGALTDLWFRDR